MERKYSILFASIFALLIGLAVSDPYCVKAGNPAKANLQPGITYSQLDITGDKKPDKILIDISKGESNPYDGFYADLSVSVNRKKCYSVSNKEFFGVEAKIYTLKNGKPFLYLFCKGDNGDGPVCGVFQYKKGRLKKVIDFQKFLTGGIHPHGNIAKVNGSELPHAVKAYGFC